MSNKYYEGLFNTLDSVLTDGTIQENNGSLLDKYKNFYQTNTNYDNGINIDNRDMSVRLPFGGSQRPLPMRNSTQSSDRAVTIMLAVVILGFMLVLKK